MDNKFWIGLGRWPQAAESGLSLPLQHFLADPLKQIQVGV